MFVRYFSNCGRLRATSKSRFKEALSLDEFIFRRKLLQIYRDLFRLIYKTHEKQELANFVRHEFRLNSQVTDLEQRKYLLNIGVTKINQMLPVMGIMHKFE